MLISSLHDPIPRLALDYLVRSQHLDKYFNSLEDKQLHRSIARPSHETKYEVTDETVKQVMWPPFYLQIISQLSYDSFFLSPNHVTP